MCSHGRDDIKKEVKQLSEDNYFPYKGSGPWFTCKPDGEMAPRVAATGRAGPETPIMTLPALLAKAAKEKGSAPSLCVERPCPDLVNGVAPAPEPREKWKTWTLKEYHEDVRKTAKAYISLGFKQFDTVNIWGFNSPEWFISAIAAMFAGGKCGGIYPTDTPATAGYKVVHSGGVIVCVETAAHFEKVTSALVERGDCHRVKGFVAWGYEPPAGQSWDLKGAQIPVMGWTKMLEAGSAQPDTELEARLSATNPGQCCALIYTSGTTGDPKAVMISHDNLTYCANAVFGELGKSQGVGVSTEEERVLSYLPLSHIAGLAVDVGGQIMIGALTKSTNCVFFARPYDLKVGTIKDRLCIARPTLFIGVPLVWEKMADRIRAIGAASGGCKKAISTWAKGKALEHAKNIVLGGNGEVPTNHCLAMKLMNAIKGAVGLDKCKYAFTGAAPIRVDTLEYFGSLGIYINEVYGMSESAGCVTMSTDQAHVWGSCGWQLPGSEVKCFKVDPSDLNKKEECPLAPSTDAGEEFQGEICFRGRGIMMGYLACSDLGDAHLAEIEKKTAETIDKEGWLHSGDKGLKTKTGMVKITGRYKELIIGEGGENIAPVPIEDSVKGLCDGVAECMMIGDQRKYNVCFITLKAKGANGEVPGTDDLDAAATLVNPKVQTISGAMKDPVWIDTIMKAITQTNNNAKLVLNNAFKIQKFCILPENFSEEKNQLTPTKKLKRKAVETQYASMIDRMYETEGTYIEYQTFE